MTKKKQSILNVNPNNQSSLDLQTMFNLASQANQQRFYDKQNFDGNQVLVDSQKESQKW